MGCLCEVRPPHRAFRAIFMTDLRSRTAPVPSHQCKIMSASTGASGSMKRRWGSEITSTLVKRSGVRQVLPSSDRQSRLFRGVVGGCAEGDSERLSHCQGHFVKCAHRGGIMTCCSRRTFGLSIHSINDKADRPTREHQEMRRVDVETTKPSLRRIWSG